MEILPEEENAEKILYLIFKDLNEYYQRRRLRSFEEAMEDFLESKNFAVQEVIYPRHN